MAKTSRRWPSAPEDRTLGIVDFAVFPHLDVFPTNTLEAAERWAAERHADTCVGAAEPNDARIVSDGLQLRDREADVATL